MKGEDFTGIDKCVSLWEYDPTLLSCSIGGGIWIVLCSCYLCCFFVCKVYDFV